ncbi:hypothetical protein OOT55_04240 [Marinimicrobium sp. C6131]|uniref:DUF6795 domain-containing protein n=1 Tax=Marinimicrobium sp. C6131 TaxID=3022676 RepID=UPI00223E19FB|nr:DUF6795 domain-containing protein [Marinimicrobium sp. C6131]UZJ45272.1 hypothetical protein OOT55_04240 [Marinimicrobium sp. C6131]
MAFFSKKEVVLSSPFAAQITYQGKPASGARIKRIIKWQSQVGEEDFAEADDQGHFSFPAIRDSWRRLLPAEFVVYQDIVVQYQDQEFKIWIGSKREEHEWSELGGEPINMHCELTDEIRRVDVKRGLLGTNCHWERIEVR